MSAAVANAIRDHAEIVNGHRLSKREEVWLRAYCACAASSNIVFDVVALGWADTCLKAFDLRFNAPSSSHAPEGKPATSPEPAP